jgi:hypothetical protein
MKNSNATGYLDPHTNIIHKNAIEIDCHTAASTMISLNGSTYEYTWKDGTYRLMGDIAEMKTKAFHPNITFQPLPLNIYREDREMVPIADIYSKGELLNDFVETIAFERKRMRQVGLWPNSGKIATSDITTNTSKLNFFDWFTAGWHKILQYWTIAVNGLVTLFVLVVMCQCFKSGVKRLIPQNVRDK